MALADDPGTVLEQWILDQSNLAPEINHLLEEIEAKDKVVQECRNIISSRDMSIQKHLKSAGVGTPHPKEGQYVEVVKTNFDKAQAIQEEKCALSEKASLLLDRHIKRLDQQIRQLENSGAIPPDPLMPSLLNTNAALRTSDLTALGGTTPLNQINGNAAAGTAAPSTTLANSALARLVTTGTSAASGGGVGGTVASSSGRGASPAATPTSATSQTMRAARESSLDTVKRRRLNLPTASSNLRQSSAGPGTPKAGTPQPGAGGRAGSVPRATNKKEPKSAIKHLALPKGGQVNPAAKRKKKSGGAGGGGGGGRRKGGVSDADDSAMSAAGDESGSERLSAVGGVGAEHQRGKDGAADRDVDMGGVEDDEDDEGGDTNLYCTCRSVSYGNMVACDNDDCPYEWFHWGCVGLTKEPAGKWYCEECRTKLGLK